MNESQAADREAARYINAIRNPDKKHYAGLWWQLLKDNTYKPDPKGLSFMAAQAVRLHLQTIWDKYHPEPDQEIDYPTQRRGRV